jgi:hypothetical protein
VFGLTSEGAIAAVIVLAGALFTAWLDRVTHLDLADLAFKRQSR